MAATVARAWSADWVPGYLAALGVVALVDGATLAWTDEASPAAAITAPGGAPVAKAIAGALPDQAAIEGLSIARHHAGSDVEMSRKVTPAIFRDRARLARSSADGSLEATVTDLAFETGKDLDHGPLDPPAPRGLTLHQRLMNIRAALPPPNQEAWVADSLGGRARRVTGNGLGFDIRRVDSSVQAHSSPLVDAVVELLAFYGMLQFPVRGSKGRIRQRGWSGGALARGSFSWPAWTQPLDHWGIDALLDCFYAMKPDRAGSGSRMREEEESRLGIHAVFSSVSRQPRGSLDVTRGLSSERLR